ncbi:hypothetical protein [Nocardia sp. CDC160]|uniref:hypothetical protein n=1 Tax=Nocardia sp. CDC160 TaxID=3112166 RepID=UPI002DBBF397|nr:hypothetical protein [Nocardia sp. CDC160]MEC3916871.1 hypothetical protein [Nocardia sp. CDC160]
MSRFWPTAALATGVLITAACGHSDKADGDSTTALPLCADVHTTSGAPPDCRLVSRDRAGLTFVVRHQAATPTTGAYTQQADVTIEVIGRDGAVRQKLSESGTQTFGEPQLANLADDNRDQLVVPLWVGANGNATLAVYRATDAAPDFVRAGEIGGLFGVNRSTNGYIVGSSKSGPADKYIDFWRFDGSKLVRVAGIIETYTVEGSSTCKANDEGNNQNSGMSDDEVAQKFCAEKYTRADPVH